MTTLLPSTLPDGPERLHELTELSHDERLTPVDRLALRVGLWLLLRAERRTRTPWLREQAVLRAVARDEYTRTRREADLVRAAVTLHYR
ncbi:hypothetical protein [Microbacterium luticocti]|uniref:hypothetical protein n=1 Tax=Microbacterium luticocti TaxID=451764 RepID=UPI000409A2F7|nr:hypothetical protein [Microbacterium luticocti]